MSNTTLHPIGLEQVVFTKVHVAAVAGYEPKEDAPASEPINTLDVRQLPNETGRYQAVMTTVINAEREAHSPYSIDIECLAVLNADDSLSQADAMRGVTITAHNVLYGAIRETVAWLTGRQPFGPMLLTLTLLRAPEKKAPEPDQE